jgi:hypothetical protein
MKGELTMKREKKIAELIIPIGFIFFLITSFSFGSSWFEKEKEVPDEYLTTLFAPGFSYESIKVMEDSKGRRFIVIRAKDKIEGKILREYDDLLLSRGISIYGTFHYGMFSWQKTVTDYAITLTRKVNGEPNAIEISESVVKNPEKNEPIVAASAKGKEIRIAIEKDFGKRWEKIRIIPGKEPDAPEPKIGRYPGAKLRYAHKWPSDQGGGRAFIYVSKDSLKSIYDFYEIRTKESFIKVYETILAREIVGNPEAYSHNPIKIFDIRTIGRVFSIAGYNHVPKEKWNSIEIKWQQSLDPNLSNFIQIEINERGD